MLTETTEQESVFTTTRSQRGFIKSALFLFTKDLIAQRNPLVDVYQTKTITRPATSAPQASLRQAILIELPIDTADTAVKTLFPNYACKRQHLTIDQFYHTDEANHVSLSNAHYTAEYTSENHPLLNRVVHVYFNREGQIEATSVKEVNFSTGISSLLPFDLNTTNQIRKNAAISQELLQNLLFQKSKQYEMAQQSADAFEKSLEETVTKAIGSNNPAAEREKIISSITKFRQAIDTVNRLCDTEADKRVVFKNNILNFVEKTQMAEQNRKQNVSVKEMPVREEKTTIIAPVKKKNTKKLTALETEVTKEMQALKDLANTLSQHCKALKEPHQEAFKLENLIAIHQLALDIKYQEVVLLFHAKFQTVKEEVTKLNDQINREMALVPSLDDLFNDLFSKGSVESFRCLFEALGSQLKPRFYGELLQALEKTVIEKESETAVKQIKILDYFFEKSVLYRSAFIAFSRIARGSKINDTTFSLTPIARAILLKNLDFFSMCLRHGHSVDLAVMHYEEEALSLIQVIIRFSDKDKSTDFLNQALKFGAVVDSRMSTKVSQVSIDRGRELLANPQKLKNHIKKISSQTRDSDMPIEPLSDIFQAVESEQFALFSLLAPFSRLEDLSIALVRLCLRSGFISNFLPFSMNSGVFFASDETARIQVIRDKIKINEALSATQKRMAHIIVPAGTANLTSMESDEVSRAIEAGSLELRNRLQTTSAATIDQILKNFQKSLKEAPETILKLRYGSAAIFLLTHQDKLSVADQTNLFILFYTLGFAFEYSEDRGFKKRAYDHYNNALLVVEHGIPKYELEAALSAFGPESTNYIQTAHQQLRSLGRAYQPIIQARQPVVTPGFEQARASSRAVENEGVGPNKETPLQRRKQK